MLTSARSAAWYFQHDGDTLVDAAIASLGDPTPPLMAVLAEPDSISVLPHLDSDMPAPPPPWSLLPEIDSWICSTSALPSMQVVPASRPVLVPVGTSRGGVLLVNLEAVSPLAITGHPSDVTAVLRAWALVLLLAPRRVLATAAAATAHLGTLNSDRVITASDTDALHHQLATRGVNADVLIVNEHTASADRIPAGTCVITTATDGAEHWHFRVTGQSGTLANDRRGLALPLDTITAIDNIRWETLLTELAAETPPAATQEPSMPPPVGVEPLTGAAPATATPAAAPHIWVRVMGEPVITPPDGRTIDDPGRSRAWTSVITYLATVGRDGATREELRDCWGATSTVSDQSIRQTVSRIRSFLGSAPDGRPLLPELGRGGRPRDGEPPQAHRLDPAVLTDWEHFQQLVGERPATASDEALAEALALVRGPAFDVPANLAARYEWAKFLNDDITDAVPDTAVHLATRRLDRGDRTGALTAAQAGLKANPARQDLWRLALSATDGPDRAALSRQLHKAVPGSEIELATRKLLP